VAVAILQEAFRRKQASRPGYSRRALARDLGLSAAFVSVLLRGKKIVPKDRLPEICRVFELDVHERAALISAVLLDDFSSNSVAGQRKRSTLAARKPCSENNKALLARWWNLAVLEGLTLPPPLNEPNALAPRLGLAPAQLREALDCLIALGLVERAGDGYIAKEEHLYAPTGRSKHEVREFHDQMIEKARHELAAKTADGDFHRRLITGFTFTVDPSRIEALKARLLEFLSDFAGEAAAGSNCSDVYQCNAQLFPLTARAEPLVELFK
jgi:uncharacterized protein (TIGR02147 family)